MDDIWIITWFNHTAFDANPIWKSPRNHFKKQVLEPQCAVVVKNIPHPPPPTPPPHPRLSDITTGWGIIQPER